MKDLSRNLVKEVIMLGLREDLEPAGDLSSFLIMDPEGVAIAKIFAREPGIMTCSFLVEEILLIAREYLLTDFLYGISADINVNTSFTDGESFQAGDLLFEIKGAAILLLATERLILNFLQRLTGIATLTKELVCLLTDTQTKLLDTRKTSPGMRFLEKKAFFDGTGTNHRFNLSDMIMLKENHISLSRFTEIKEALTYCKTEIELRNLKNLNDERLKIEVEINKENLPLLEEVLREGLADIIMLDNFSPAELTGILEMIRDIQKINKLAKKVLIEISGGINPENISEYGKLGADFISSSYVSKHTHSLDLSMLIEKL